MDDTTSRRRLTRAESKARTRQQLLDAAGRVISKKGCAAASVEEIAETAGYSPGAFYSNFRNKNELMAELMTTRTAQRADESAQALAHIDSGAEDAATVFGRQVVAAADTDVDATLLHAELWLYAMRNPELGQAMSEQMQAPLGAIRELMRTVLDRLDDPGDATPDEAATVVMALFQGLVRLRLVDRQLVPEQLYGRALHWLFAGIAAQGRGDGRSGG